MQTYSHKPDAIERIISALTYMTSGGAGFVWLILALLLRKNVTNFLMYHILQSIFISMAFWIVSFLAQMIYVILYRIPLINAIPYYLNYPISFALNLSILQIFTTIVILYLAITAFMGYYSYLPVVSDIIKGNTNR